MTTRNAFFLVKDQNGGFQRVNYADILFIKSVGNYLQFVTPGGTITTYGSLQSLQNNLENDERFMRIHRSFIINLEMIDHVSSEVLTINKHQIPIGNKFLEAFRTDFIQAHLMKL